MALRQSPANRPSHYGELALKFEKRSGKTVVTSAYQLPPLRSSRALHFNQKIQQKQQFIWSKQLVD